MSMMMLLGAGSSGVDSGSGVAEVTQINAVGDSYGYLHGRFFNLYKSGDVRVAVFLDCGATRAQYNITFETGTAGPVFYLAVNGGSSFEFVWGDSGDGGAVNMFYTSASVPVPAEDIAAQFESLVLSQFAGTCSVYRTGNVVTLTAGGVAVGSASTIQVNNSTVASGRDSATPPSGISVNLRVSINDDADAMAVAGSLAGALIEDGSWSVAIVDEVLTITDNATGPRTDAFDGDIPTGFTITTLTQGA